MRASLVTMMVVMTVRAVVRMTATGPAVTTAPDSGGNVVGNTSCDAEGGMRYEGVVPIIRSARIPILRWLGMRVRAAASERRGSGRDEVCH